MLIHEKGGCKKQKLYQEQDIDERIDVISSLPDCMLSHILSFLPTKYAVGTCILSTRWRDLWADLSNFDFDDGLFHFGNMGSWYPFEYVPFMNFVERILIHRDISNITRFRLSCRVCFCPSRVSAWISCASIRNVQELDLRLELEEPFSLPCCVFNCHSLRVLKIDMECALILPQTVSLPNLKILYLVLVGFSDEKSASKLFSGCSSLEELYLLDCDWRRFESFTISIPKLRRLRIDDSFYWGSPNESSDCIIEVQAPNLNSFEYLGNLSNEILLANKSSIAEASIFVVNQPERKFDIASSAFRLFYMLRNAKFLKLSSATIKSLLVAERFFGEPHMFQKLTHMELSVGNGNHFLDNLCEFLRSFPHLEFLAFPEGLDPYIHIHQDVRICPSASKYRLSRLKTINLHCIHGTITEMNILKYLVESAPALERIAIVCSGNLSIDSKKKNEIRLQVQTLLDGSKRNLTVFSL